MNLSLEEALERLKVKYGSYQQVAVLLHVNTRTVYRWLQGHWGPNEEHLARIYKELA